MLRVTSNWIADRMLSHIGGAQNRMVRAQELVASGKRINRPSDDPFGTSQVLALATRSTNNEQYQRNAAVANQDLSAVEGALTSLHGVLARAHELSIQASNASISATNRAHIGLEVVQLLSEAITVGNTKFGDRYLFAGHATNTLPFTEDVPGNPTTVAYTGNAGVIQREVSQGERLTVNIPGNQVFAGAFTALISFRDALMGNDLASIQGAAADFSTAMDVELSARSEVGSRMQRLDVAVERLQDEEALMQVIRSDIEDVDMSEAIVRLETQQVAYEAALGATGRTLGLSLLDFLR